MIECMIKMIEYNELNGLMDSSGSWLSFSLQPPAYFEGRAKAALVR
jgi:hypothetical protein